jgi:sterol desaturase/sphingolipid hydroxylase (fatty acid hydroxylase superfamily)
MSSSLAEYGYAYGLKMGLATVGLTVVLELTCLDKVAGVLSDKKGGRRLYGLALLANVVNNLGMGPPLYAFAAKHLCVQKPLAPFACAFATLGVLVVQAFGFYYAHWAMHRPSFFWAHRFHHRFNTFITPSAANAVTPVEYMIAYMLPIIVGIFLFSPDATALAIAVWIVSFNNLLEHTEWLSPYAEKYLPACFVGTHEHTEHHRKLTTNYAAPTFNIDWFFAKAAQLTQGKKNQ